MGRGAPASVGAVEEIIADPARGLVAAQAVLSTGVQKRRRASAVSICAARSLLVNTPCTHHGLIKEYQRALAETWKIDEVAASDGPSSSVWRRR